MRNRDEGDEEGRVGGKVEMRNWKRERKKGMEEGVANKGSTEGRRMSTGLAEGEGKDHREEKVRERQ